MRDKLLPDGFDELYENIKKKENIITWDMSGLVILH